ncbi:MAG: hypothetical protein ACXVZ1_01530, partial [Gaiellaceae bacterium]
TLADGSRPAPVPRALHELPRAVMTRLATHPLRALPRSLVASCRALPRSLLTSGARAALRVGRTGTTLTVVDRSRRLVFGCDRPPSSSRAPRWCEGTTGKLVRGRLLDPRLALCAGRKSGPVAFAWVDPLPHARWIVVRDGRVQDVYETDGVLPVRVATTQGIDLARAAARFSVGQRDPLGRLLSQSTLEAAVAG